jgi:hypothetical protein
MSSNAPHQLVTVIVWRKKGQPSPVTPPLTICALGILCEGSRCLTVPSSCRELLFGLLEEGACCNLCLLHASCTKALLTSMGPACSV